MNELNKNTEEEVGLISFPEEACTCVWNRFSGLTSTSSFSSSSSSFVVCSTSSWTPDRKQMLSPSLPSFSLLSSSSTFYLFVLPFSSSLHSPSFSLVFFLFLCLSISTSSLVFIVSIVRLFLSFLPFLFCYEYLFSLSLPCCDIFWLFLI